MSYTKHAFASLAFLASVASNVCAKEIVRFDFGLNDRNRANFENVDFVKGLDGSALAVNEYNSRFAVKGDVAQPETFAVSAWIAPRMYPINAGAIANRIDSERGWLIGLNKEGNLEIYYAEGGRPPTSVIVKRQIPLLKWSHIAVLFSTADGLKVFIDGRQEFVRKLKAAVDFSDAPLELGRSQIPLPIKTVEGIKRHANLKATMRFDGLIEDFVITDGSLAEVEKAAKSGKTGSDSGLKYARLPASASEIPQGAFGAYYLKLKYEPTWDALWRVGDHPDVVVRFADNPCRLVFWRGMGFVPALVTENDIWLTDQSLENFRGGECSEVMSDKQCRYSHVRIIESTAARAIVHWRYAMTNVLNEIRDEDETGWGEWVDEYYTIYPDGVGVREQLLHSKKYLERKQWGYQFQETIIINQAGTKPSDNLDDFAMTFSDMDGNSASYSWLGKSPVFDKPQVQPIQTVNTKSKYRPFGIFEPTRKTKSFLLYDLWGKETPYHCRNHYPVTQYKNDGQRYVAGVDRPTHTSLAETVGAMQKFEQNGKDTYAVRQMFGFTQGTAASLVPLARSWNFPPRLNLANPEKFLSSRYDFYRRCYVVAAKDGGAVSELCAEFAASKESPLCNVGIQVENFSKGSPEVYLNGKKLEEGKDFFAGHTEGVKGSRTVFFIYVSAESPAKIEIK